MSTIVTRAGKGSPLTHTEVDNNFTNLNTDKYQSGDSASFSSITNTGNLTFTGTGNRITGDFSNATVANRVLLQTSTVNSNTAIQSIPNGTAVVSQFSAFNNSDPTNASLIGIRSSDTEGRLEAARAGSGTFLPLTMYTGGSERLRIDTSGNVLVGLSTRVTGLSGLTQLEVSGANGGITINSTDTGASNFCRLMFTKGGATGNEGVIRYNTNDYHMAFWTNNTERMRIDSSGNVGIGTSSPSYLLDVNGTIRGRAAGGGEGGQIDLNNPDNNSVGLTVDIGSADTARVFSTRNNFSLQLGQLGGTGGVVTLHTAASERMRIDSSGNVGIGTSSPNTKLHIFGASISDLRIASNNVSYVNYVDTGFSVQGTTTNHPMVFNTNNTERMRIDSSGKVGIAATSMTYHLEVGNGTGDTRFVANPNNAYAIGVKNGANNIGGWIGSPSGGVLSFSANDGTERMRIDSSGNVAIGNSSPNYRFEVMQSNPTRGLLSQFRNTASASQTGAQIQVTQNGIEDWAFGQPAGVNAFAFWSGRNLNNDGTERMRITSGGITIYGSSGTTTANANKVFIEPSASTESGRVTVVGNNNAGGALFLGARSDTQGSTILIRPDGDLENANNSYGALSDIKLKQDITDAGSQWEDIKALRVRKYRFKSDPNEPLQIGVIAQELETTSPGLVKETNDDLKYGIEEGSIKTVKYSVLYMKAVKALQEAMERIEKLEAKVTQLESK